MLANAPSSQTILSQLKYPASWTSYFTAMPSEEVLECLQVCAPLQFELNSSSE